MTSWDDTHILNDLRRCVRCTLPETHETIQFDEEGICNICRQHEFKKAKINWNDKLEELKKLCDNYRGKGDYDCILPFSGGKDSTFTLWYIVEKLNLKPLVVSFDHGFYRSKLLENNERTIRKLGVDFLKFRIDWKLMKKIMLESFKKTGDFEWHAHVGTFAYPVQIAVKHKIPLIFWGEPSSEYTAYYTYDDNEDVNEDRFSTLVNLGISSENMLQYLGQNYTVRDLSWSVYPSVDKLKEIGIRSIPLGSYIPWNVKNNFEIINKELGWEGDVVEGVPPIYPYEKIEYQLQGTRDYAKFIKRGYARTTHLTSIDIRNGLMTRDKASELIEKYEGKKPASLPFLLQILEIDEQKWRDILTQHSVPPYSHDFSTEKIDESLWDMQSWFHET